MMTWISFFLAAVVIIFAGIRLTHYADRLAEKTSVGRAWIGILLLGFITSLPEAVTSLVAVISLQQEPHVRCSFHRQTIPRYPECCIARSFFAAPVGRGRCLSSQAKK